MKGFFLALVVLAVTACAYAGPPPPEFRQYIDECKAELGVTEDRPRHDDPKAKCFHACLMKKSGKMANGKVLLDKELEMLEKRMPNADDSLKAKVAECVNKANAESDECEVAHSMGRCLRENNLGPHHGPHKDQ